MKLIHITDTHFVAHGLRLYGLDPRQRLDAAIADVNANHADADLAIITGDLTHWGEIEAYENLRECLAALAVPCIPLIGNHDDRETFRQIFPAGMTDANGFVQGQQDTPAGTFLFLDTNKTGTHAGWYCEDRLIWLESCLRVTEGPVFLFMHHPPFRTGIPAMDKIGIVQAEAFRDVVEPYAYKIRHLFYGHVHRPICGSWLGIPTSTIRATSHQVWLDFTASIDDVPFSYEEPAYAIVLINDDTVVVHTHDYLYGRGTYAAAVNATPEKERAYALSFRKAAAE